MSYPKNINIISSIDSLHGINGAAAEQVKAKIQCCLDPHSINFLQRSPFMVLASSSDSGADVSPRGCDRGFARVIDDTTLLLPEQPGNKLAESMSNIIRHRAIGMLFMIPGMNETLRINGDAFVTDDKDYLSEVTYRGKPPKLAILVDIHEVYFHCAKALIRSRLWDSSLHMDRSEMPTLGKILAEQILGQAATAEIVSAVDEGLAADERDNLYHS